MVDGNILTAAEVMKNKLPRVWMLCSIASIHILDD